MTDRPSGTVTFLFTDIEGSTQLLQDLGDLYAGVLANHFDILRDALAAHGGHEESTEGDSIFVVFPGAVEAVQAAIEIQRSLGAHRWPDGASVRVRMGLHSGEAAYGTDGYVGIDVHRAARISAIAHGGQIVVSASTAALVSQSLPADVSLQSLGPHRLRDLSQAEELSQIVAPGLDREFPPLRSLDSVPHNLPVQLTSFIGREADLAEVANLLSENRLVTLTGVGGTGKTRLAMQVSAERVHDFSDGVWVVDLGPVTSGEMVDNAIGTALGVRDQPGRALIEAIGDALHGREVLIILDNCEHLLAASADVVSAVLRAGPAVKVLATSREGLGVAGEVTVGVPPLSGPAPSAKTAHEVVAYDSTVLFQDRAALARPGFKITDDNAEAVGQICRMLDAVPLAIELAAARVRVLSPQEIVEHLDDRFRLLTGGSRTAVARHQTLEATVAWSYDHLSDGERLLFSRLAVFGGSFTLEAAKEVTESSGIDGWDVLDLVSGLIEKSMLILDSEDGAKSRYRLLETLRQYAMGRLMESGTADLFRRRHAVFFADLAERGDLSLHGADQEDWFHALEREHDNFAAALSWTLDADEGDLFLRIAGSLGYFWGEIGHWEEGRHWLMAGPVTDETQPANLRAKALIAAVTVIVPENPERALEIARQALDLSQAVDEDGLAAAALREMGYASIHMFLPEQAVSMLEKSLELFRSIGERWGEASSLGAMSNALSHLDPDKAAKLSRQSRGVFEELGDRLATAENLYVGGAVANRQDDPRYAIELIEKALDLYRQLGSSIGQGHSLHVLGRAMASLSQPSEARGAFQEALTLLTNVGDAHCSARVQSDLGLLDLDEADPARAEERFRDALVMSSRVDDKLNIVWALEGMAQTPQATRNIERATILMAAAGQLRETLETPRSREEERRRQRRLNDLGNQPDSTSFAAAWKRGEEMDQDQAVTYALGRSPTADAASVGSPRHPTSRT